MPAFDRAKHEAIAQTLQERIRRRVYTSKIPGERILSREFSVNFKTANRAVGLLVSEGVLERRRGKGTFISRRPPRRRTLLGFAFHRFRPAMTDLAWAEVFMGANAAAKARGCLLDFACFAIDPAPGTRATAARRAAFLEEIERAHPRGILYCGDYDKRLLADLDALGPVVQVGAFGRAAENYVRRDPADGVGRAYAALADAGRGRIAWVTYPPGSPDLRAKLDGYRRAAAADGRRYACEITVPFLASHEAAGRLLAGAPVPDACICAESSLGVALLRGLASAGVRVPADLAIWSFDERGIGPYTIPPLSGIRLYDDEVGVSAANALVEIVEGSKTQPVRETLPAVLVSRTSG
ncbi:MAG: substrate-binding domain-containing protein [Kiritimatiellae bacterium]|nr:substrate-binding domain-containing protein [Kiritimatiellia bacterium]